MPGRGMSMHGQGMGHYELEEGEEYCDYDALDAEEEREMQAHARQLAQGRDPRQGHDPWTSWRPPQPERPAWAQDSPTPAWAHEGAGAALMRTNSQGYPKSPGKKSKKRSNSFGGGQLQGGWGTPIVFDEHHLSRRPEDWREGYSSRGISGADISFSSLFRVGRRSSDPNEWSGDTKKRTLATALTFNFTRPNISYDLRRPPEETPFMGSFQPQSQREMMQPAATPAPPRMRLMHPRLPWYIDVVPGFHNTPGVTLYDVLRTLFIELDRAILSRDFWNEELGRRERESLTHAFKERCSRKGKHMQEEIAKGVKRVDFLGLDCVFVGLVRRNGMWEIKTESH
ncbi:hypothetical protein B0H19DRAFT_1196427 [Mycena capillaripes]|nr:hypothetical protein B0H19DRAFT_1196427 [Mycena capillaripes]